MSDDSTPLPTYLVRESLRAKRVTLRVSTRLGVEVVVPKGFDTHQVPGIVALRGDWLRGQVRRLTEQGWSPEPPTMPEALDLRALGRTLRIETAHAPRKPPRLTLSGPDCLLLSGDMDDAQACRAKVLTWIKEQARLLLVPWLRELSATCELPFERARIRAQKSRWGSCSARGTISLNCKLLFLPRPLARHVLLHELAHLRHLNHSPQFWALLHVLDQDAAARDPELSGAWRYVPRWLD
ncbi:MAG: M48 family metallopeptidase [Proteobacteria bacterium]|nr:M48 family metallopeptidase [Pseudomonadota bacterium]